MGGDRFWTRESVVTYRLNRTFLRRTLSVGAAIALMGVCSQPREPNLERKRQTRKAMCTLPRPGLPDPPTTCW